MEPTLEELQKEADDLGIKYNKLLGAAKLQKLIDDEYEKRENKDLEQAINKNKENKEKETSSKELDEDEKLNIEIERIKTEANKTKLVQIIDNDNRVNHKTTAAVVNCSNEYFDLGTIILPLNKPVEVRQGHLNVLKEVRIPQHRETEAGGLSTYTLIKRYTIEYLDKDDIVGEER